MCRTQHTLTQTSEISTIQCASNISSKIRISHDRQNELIETSDQYHFIYLCRSYKFLVFVSVSLPVCICVCAVDDVGEHFVLPLVLAYSHLHFHFSFPKKKSYRACRWRSHTLITCYVYSVFSSVPEQLVCCTNSFVFPFLCAKQSLKFVIHIWQKHRFLPRNHSQFSTEYYCQIGSIADGTRFANAVEIQIHIFVHIQLE